MNAVRSVVQFGGRLSKRRGSFYTCTGQCKLVVAEDSLFAFFSFPPVKSVALIAPATFHKGEIVYYYAPPRSKG